MNLHSIARDATYRVTKDGDILTSSGVDSYKALRDKIDILRHRLDGFFAAALMVKVLREMPWVEGFDVKLDVDSEYDDQGGYYRVVAVIVSDATTVRDARIPDEVMSNGEFDADQAAETIADVFEEHATDLHAAFVPYDNAYDDVEFKVSRILIADLLEAEEVDARQAFVRMFPLYKERMAPLPWESEVV
jgi:hypothetical protein